MCPACMASAALLAGGVITTGGFAALVAKIFHARRRVKTNHLDVTTDKEK